MKKKIKLRSLGNYFKNETAMCVQIIVKIRKNRFSLFLHRFTMSIGKRRGRNHPNRHRVPISILSCNKYRNTQSPYDENVRVSFADRFVNAVDR